MRTAFLYSLILMTIGAWACKSKDKQEVAPVIQNKTEHETKDTMKLKIIVGNSTYTATLYNNPTVDAFKEKLPLSIDMTELNRNEKYYDLEYSLPTNASNPGTIEEGDLMLYGSRTLVLFYKSFPTSYPYTRLGKIDHPEGLAKALGSESIKVRFELQ